MPHIPWPLSQSNRSITLYNDPVFNEKSLSLTSGNSFNRGNDVCSLYQIYEVMIKVNTVLSLITSTERGFW